MKELDELELDEAVLQDEPELVADAADADALEPSEAGDDLPAHGPNGPDELQAGPIAPALTKRSLCCELDFWDPFTVYVRIVNPGTFLTDCSDFFAGENDITVKIFHYYNSPAPVTITTGPIPLESTRVISLSHPGYLNAMSCEAYYEI